MSRLALIVNQKCRQNRKDPRTPERLRGRLGEGDLFFLTHDAESLWAAAQACRREDVEVVGIHGGDGTLHWTVTRLIHAYEGARLPAIAFLRGGTQNTVANSCGVRASPEQMLDYLAKVRARGGSRVLIERDVLRVGARADGRGDDGARTDSYGFIFGNGFVYQFLAEYYGLGEPSQWNALRTLVAGCTSVALRGEIAKRMFRRFKGKVTVDGQRWPAQEFTGVVGSTIEQVGLGFRPFVRCDERPGAFHILGITASAVDFVLELPKIRLGMPLNDRKILNAVCREVVFDADEPLRFMIDGELHDGTHRLELGVGPRLRLVVPQR